jgi:hypothetical protein
MGLVGVKEGEGRKEIELPRGAVRETSPEHATARCKKGELKKKKKKKKKKKRKK